MSLFAVTVFSPASPPRKDSNKLLVVATADGGGMFASNILDEVSEDAASRSMSLLVPSEDVAHGRAMSGEALLTTTDTGTIAVAAPPHDEADAGILSHRPDGTAGSKQKSVDAASSSSLGSRRLVESITNDASVTPTTSTPSTSPSAAPATASPSVTPTTSSPSAAPSTASPTMLPTAIPTYSMQCPAGYVDCVDGHLKTNISTSCETACQGKCCSGPGACTNFTGKICKDGSCNITESCFYAAIPLVVNSCKGVTACLYADRVGSIVNSCYGDSSCMYFGLYSPGNETRHIRDSCNGFEACDSVAYYGSIGNITSSCNAVYACFMAGSPPPNGTGLISSILNSCCNSASACEYTNEDTIPALCFSTTQVR